MAWASALRRSYAKALDVEQGHAHAGRAIADVERRAGKGWLRVEQGDLGISRKTAAVLRVAVAVEVEIVMDRHRIAARRRHRNADIIMRM